MHRWSQLFIPTLREAPADAEVASHKLLLRAGYIRQLGAGIYSYLFLGTRAINKIVAIVREEMDSIGQEMHLPALNPMEVWAESGRWAGMGDNMFRLKDRKGAELCLAMTHEEVMTAIARSELRSYKQLPQIWYQIQTKFRDEPRPKSGLLRVRQFLMKDSYSFDIDEAGLDASYAKHEAVYRRIFTRCGLEFLVVEADSGAMGGTGSQEFMVSTEAGEDLIASSSSGYAANVEKATSKLAPVADLAPTGDGLPESVHTPGQKTIDEVGAFLGVERVHQMKTMVYQATFGTGDNVAIVPVAVFIRGDHEVNETKFAAALGATDLTLMPEGEIQSVFNAPAGYLGPINSNPIPLGDWFIPAHALENLRRDGIFPQPFAGRYNGVPVDGNPRKRYYESPIIAILDAALEGRTNLVAGANKEEYHLRNVTPMRDFRPTLVADVRSVNEGELDPIGGQPLKIAKAVEIGHIFKLGYKYSKSMGASVLNRDGKETTPIMGSYGIGIERILTAAIEQSAAKFAAQSANDPKASDAYALPPSIAPFQVVVTITNVREAELLAAGEKIAADLSAAGIDVLLDDRDERAGVKFKDAELIGVPFRIAVGKKLVEGKVELLNRLTNRTDDIPVGEAVQQMQAALSGSSLEPRT
jgi:prolyl-tRNA synthetase